MPDIKETKKAEEPEIPVSNADGNVQQLLARIAQLEKDNAALKDRNKDLEHKDLLSQAEIEYLKKCMPWQIRRKTESQGIAGYRKDQQIIL